MKNEHAAALGRLNLGRKKHLTPDQRARAALRAAHARACRAAKRTFVCPKCGKIGELHIFAESFTKDAYEVWHGVKEVRKKPLGPAQIPASVVTSESRCILSADEIGRC